MADTSPGDIMELLVHLVPGGVSCGVRHVAHVQPPLPPDEATLTPRMSAARLREFTAGRTAARDALAHLGMPAASILAGPGRGPVWPAGCVGSITHTASLAAAVVADSRRFASLGLDAEDEDGLEAGLLPVVCRPEELARLGADAVATTTAKLIFSAKEAAYKCLAPLTGIFLEFHDLEIRLQPEGRSFTVLGHTPRSQAMPLAQLCCRYGQANGAIVTVCWLPAA